VPCVCLLSPQPCSRETRCPHCSGPPAACRGASRAGGPFSTYSGTSLAAVRPPCRTTSGPTTTSCPGDPWGAARTPPHSPRYSPRRNLAAFRSPQASAVLAVARLGSSTRGDRGRSGPARSLIDAHHLQHEDNDDDRADQVNDRAHVTSLPSKWRPAIRVLIVPCGSGRVVPPLPGSCGVPSPALILAAPFTPVLHGACKDRSTPLFGWPEEVSDPLNREVGWDAR